MEQSKRFVHIDLMESIAIFFVVFYHSPLYSFDFTENGSALTYILYFGTTILSTCVPLFFFANGYLLFNRSFDLKKHLKKILRLILLTIFWSLFLMVVYMLMEKEPFNLKTIVLSIVKLDSRWSMNIFWFLLAMICLYILFPALKALFDANKKAFLYLTIACTVLTIGLVFANQILTFVGALTHHSFPALEGPLLTIINPFRGTYGYTFAYFCAGGLMFTWEEKLRKVPRLRRNLIAVFGILVSCALLFLTGVFYTVHVYGELLDVVWNGYDTIYTFANVIFIYILSLNLTKDFRLIRLISCNTLGIYFIHGIIIRLTLPLVLSVDGLCNLPFNLIYALAVLFLCLFLCLILRKIPLLRKLI